MATTDEQNNIDLPTPWGHVRAQGKLVVTVILLFGLAALLFWHDQRREAAFKDLNCLIQLDIWLHTADVDLLSGDKLPFNIRRLPYALYECVPGFMVEEARR